jgi:hypothetical protein
LVAWAVREAQQYPEFRVERVVVNDTDPCMPRVYGVAANGTPVASSSWFVDDGLIVAPTRESCVVAYTRLVWVLESRLGWRISSRKTVGPAQRLQFCGLELDTLGLDVGGACTRLPETRRARCLERVQDFLGTYGSRRRAPRREMASLVGELSFAANAIPAGRCFLARLYGAIHELDEAVRGDAADYDRHVVIRVTALLDLRWWVQCLEEAACVRLWRTGSFALHRCWSDASDYGFAESLAVEGEGEIPRMAFTHGVWPEAVAGFSSNWHELATIVHSIRTRLDELRGSSVHYMTDNTTAVKAVNSGVVRSPKLMQLSRELKLLQARGNIGIEAIHLPGRLMIVQGTDGASRQAPWLGMYSGRPGEHDTFSPLDWPCFELNGDIEGAVAALRSVSTVDMSDPARWLLPDTEVAGQDTFWHLRPCHAVVAMEIMLEAQLRLGLSTSFTVVVPQVGVRAWSRFLKHFRHKKVFEVHVAGLGAVKHWLLRFEEGDAMLPRKQRTAEGQEVGEDEEMGVWWDGHALEAGS